MTGSSASRQDHQEKGRPRPPRRTGVRVLAVSFAISAAVHAAGILLYPVLMRRPELRPGDAPEPVRATRFSATRVIRLAEATREPELLPREEPPEPGAQPEPELEPESPPEDAPVFPEEEGGAAEGEPPTAAERLRPGRADPRVWRPVSPERTEVLDDERARVRLYGRLQAWNDSVAAAAEMGPVLDWTYTDDEGRRWGVSPGRLHLGGLTLPIPAFGAGGAGDLQETMQERWEVEDIERGATGARVRATLEERAKAIRERRDRERKAKADSTGSGG